MTITTEAPTKSVPPSQDGAVTARQRVPSVLRHGATLAWRGVVKTIHSPEALLDVTLQPVIFLLLFVYVFGGAISGDTHAYLQFALPGVIVQTVAFASIGTGVGLADDLRTGIFDRFRSLPISRGAPLLGAVGADLVRYLVSVLIMLVFGTILGFRFGTDVGSVVLGLAVVMVFSFALCWVFTALAMVVRDPRSVQGLSALIILPLTFGSNAFVPTATLPSWLRGWVEINPVSKVADTLRGLFLGGDVATPLGAALVWSAVIFVIFCPLAIALYRRRA